MSKRIDLSSSSIKKRVDSLLSDGVIDKFEVTLNPILLNLGLATFMVYTDASTPIDLFKDEVLKHEIVYRIHPIISGDFYVAIQHEDEEQLDSLTKTIEKIQGVTKIERYVIQNSEPSAKQSPEFNLHEIKVLEQLIDDPRMQPHEISKETGLTVGRVNKVLAQFEKDQRVLCGAIWNPNLSKSLTFTCKILYKPTDFANSEFFEWMNQTYPISYWGSRDYESHSTMFTFLTTTGISEMAEISQSILNYPGIKSCETMLHYPAFNQTLMSAILLKRYIQGDL
jgi:DNA-binding Lrp family transcriptional regulator